MPNLDDNGFNIIEAFHAIDARFQIGPQPVEALIPINPVQWPGHVIATAISDEARRFPAGSDRESLLKPLDNLQVMCEYLSSSQSDAHYNSRFGQVSFDTAVVNILTECGGYVGQMVAGDYSNEAANSYASQMVEDQLSPIEDDAIARSFRVRLRGGQGSKSGAPAHNGTSPMWNGVGLFKEELPVEARSNPLKALPTCRRPSDRPLFTYKFFGPRGGAMVPVHCFYSYRIMCFINNRVCCNILNITTKALSGVLVLYSLYRTIRYIQFERSNIENFIAKKRYTAKISNNLYLKYKQRRKFYSSPKKTALFHS